MERDARAYLSKRMTEICSRYKDSNEEPLHYLRYYVVKHFAGAVDMEIARLQYNAYTHKAVFAIEKRGFVKEYAMEYFYDEEKRMKPGRYVAVLGMHGEGKK